MHLQAVDDVSLCVSTVFAERLLRDALDLASHAAHDGRKGPRANAARHLRDSIRDFLAESDRLKGATVRESESHG